MTTPDEPSSRPDLKHLLLDYLDWYREVVAAKVSGLSDAQLRTSVLPSGWTPAGMLNHLANVERRWIVWGFLGDAVDEPWRDATPEGGWVLPELTAVELLDNLAAAGRTTRSVVAAHDLAERATPGGRFPDEDSCPQLHWIVLHLVHEYARHAGHLDVARELVDGRVGETD